MAARMPSSGISARKSGARIEVEKIGDAPSPSLLTCIHGKLPIVAACREAFAFEDLVRDRRRQAALCWVTLLPFSANGTWIELRLRLCQPRRPARTRPRRRRSPRKWRHRLSSRRQSPRKNQRPQALKRGLSWSRGCGWRPLTNPVEDAPEPFKVELRPFDDETRKPTKKPATWPHSRLRPVEETERARTGRRLRAGIRGQNRSPTSSLMPSPNRLPKMDRNPELETRSSFTAKVMERLANVGGFYGKVAQSGPDLPSEAVVEEPFEALVEEPARDRPEAAVEPFAEPASEVEGTLQNKLSEVRALAEEARQAQIRSNVALYEGLSAAYDFALDAEGAPEEYLYG